MKTARIARIGALMSILTVVGMLVAGAASAKTLSRPFNMNSYAMAIDGTDVYWSESPRVSRGRYDTVIYRGSFLNKSKRELVRFHGGFGEDLVALSAGGGYVTASVNNEFFGPFSKKSGPTSKVIRFASDGSHRSVMATGRLHDSKYGNLTFSHGAPHLNDCGTRVQAFAMSDSGSVVIGRAVSDRKTKACGGKKKDVDHWSYYEQRLDGTRREIIAKDATVHSEYKALHRGHSWRTTSGVPAFSGVQVRNDRVLFQSAASIQTFVRDLTTGAFSGPFDFTPHIPEKYSQASLSDSGAVALTTYSFKRKVGLATNTGIFPNWANPTLYAKSKSKNARLLLFCGNHLLAAPIFSRKLQELDPVTFAPIRTVATLRKNEFIISEGEFGCDHGYAYGVRFTKSYDGTLLAFPLD